MRLVSRSFLAASLLSLALSAVAPCLYAQSDLDFDLEEDYTDKIEMRPGMTIVFPITEGIDTHWKPLGNYDFKATIEKTGNDGFSYAWMMGDGTRGEGSRAVERGDLKSSCKVSLFYPKRESATVVGYTNIVRVSDALFKGLKADKEMPFVVDGPELPPEHSKNTEILPRSIHKVGEEKVEVFVNNKRVPVRTIKAETNNGWAYWILDNPAFPVIVQGDQPFKWKEPRFTIAVAEPPAALPEPEPAPALVPAQSEGKRVVSQLESKGVATTHAILFDFNSANLKPQSKAILKEIGHYLKANPAVKLKVEGHTDNVGGMQYNINLSNRRAQSVKNYLVKAMSINAARLSSAGFGYTKPVESNKTAKGRAQNRRVVFRKLAG